MSNLISIASGSWLTAGTWALVDSTSYLNSETGTTAVPNAAGASARSAAFTPGAITIDAIAVKLSVRTGTTGTLTVNLYNSTTPGDVAGTSVTINCADLQAATTAALDGGWIVFKFASPVLLLAATNYMVQCVTSSASQISLFRDGTANNWSRMLRTTTTQAPVAGDDMVVAGEYTGAGTSNAYTVTMDCTATTDHGSNTASSVTPALAVCAKGTLSYGATAATAYYLKLSGRAIVYNGGALNIGTTGTPIPRNSTAVLEFDPAADGGHGLIARNGSSLVMQGLSRTSGKNIVSCKLNTDEAINSTSLGVDSDTGWLDNDQIAVASTTQTAGQSEVGTLNGDAGASTLTVDGFAGAGGGLAYAHSGTSPTQAEVICLTRNVKVRSATSTLMAFVEIDTTAIADIDWTEFYYCGLGGNGGFIYTTTGPFEMHYSSIHDVESYGVYVNGAATNNITFAYNVMWNVAASAGSGFHIDATSGESITVDNNIIIKTPYIIACCWEILDVGLTFTNNTAVAAAYSGFIVNENNVIGTINNNVAHSCSYPGMFVAGTIIGSISNSTTWRNGSSPTNGSGIQIGSSSTLSAMDITINGATLFGNKTSSIDIYARGDITLKSITSSGDSSFVTTNGIRLGNADVTNFVIDSCDFSTASGIKTAHTNDIDITSSGEMCRAVARNCKFGAATPVATQGNLNDKGFISSQKDGQVAGAYRTWMRYGTLQSDTAIYNTASPSLRMTPTSASNKLESATQFRGIQVAVANGDTVTVNVYTRKSVAGDGAAYNGNQPRLILKANPSMGIAADAVIATHSAAAGSWQQVGGTTSAVTDDGVLEFVVDCDGSAGWVNVDDWGIN